MSLYPSLDGMKTKLGYHVPLNAATQNEVIWRQNNASNGLPYPVSPLVSLDKSTSRLYPSLNVFKESGLCHVVTQDKSEYTASAPPYEDQPEVFAPTITPQSGAINNMNTVSHSVPNTTRPLIPTMRNTSILYPTLNEFTRLEPSQNKNMENTATTLLSNNYDLKSNVCGFRQGLTSSTPAQFEASHIVNTDSDSTLYPMQTDLPARRTSGSPGTAQYPAMNEFAKSVSFEDTITKDIPDSTVSPLSSKAHTTVYGFAPWVTSEIAHKQLLSNNNKSNKVVNDSAPWATSESAQKELMLCKNNNSMIGLCIKSVNDGIFVFHVVKGSNADQLGLRFGDQILQVNGTAVSGLTENKVRDLIRGSSNNCSLVIRSKPYETTVTLEKDCFGQLGFQFMNGKIIRLVNDSPAVRSGLLTDHHLIEVNGVNVIRLKDADITSIIQESGPIITITVIPSVMYRQMMKVASKSILKNLMDNTIQEV